MTDIDPTLADLVALRAMLERLLPSGYAVTDIGNDDLPSGQYEAFKVIGPDAEFWVTLRKVAGASVSKPC